MAVGDLYRISRIVERRLTWTEYCMCGYWKLAREYPWNVSCVNVKSISSSDIEAVPTSLLMNAGMRRVHRRRDVVEIEMKFAPKRWPP